MGSLGSALGIGDCRPLLVTAVSLYPIEYARMRFRGAYSLRYAG